MKVTYMCATEYFRGGLEDAALEPGEGLRTGKVSVEDAEDAVEDFACALYLLVPRLNRRLRRLKCLPLHHVIPLAFVDFF